MPKVDIWPPQLTREVVLAMPAGPEMDALVAERVMGRCLHTAWDDEGPYIGSISPGTRVKCRTCGIQSVIGYRQKGVLLFGELECPPYSTDIAAAWEVVEQLRKHGKPKDGLCDAAVMVQWGSPQGDMAHCAIREFAAMGYVGLPTFADIEISAPTAPLAICRAALLTTLESK